MHLHETMRHVRSLRSGKAYAEFIDEAILESAAVSDISQVVVSQTQKRILPTAITLSSLSLSSFDHPPQYMLANVDGWLRLAAVSRRVRALPPELLEEIFYFCLPFHDEQPHVPNPRHAPLVLCAVCRLWRNIALTAPRLWSSICFDLSTLADRPKTVPAQLYVDLCRSWLSRAQSIPLSISFDEYVPGGHPLLELICGLSYQWRDIHLGEILPQLSLPVDGKYPFLEKLYITSPASHHPTLSFHDASRLRDVFIPKYTTKIQLPWHQLTKFRTDNIDIRDCIELLRHALNLVDAHLGILHDSTVLPNTIFTLPQLEYLTLSGARNEDGLIDGGVMFMNFLQCLTTPALNTLTLGSTYARWSDTFLDDVSPFQSFLSRSSPQLHTLKLFRVPTTADALVVCLKATPLITHLELRISHHIDDMNPLFAQFTGYRAFLPKLQHLQITFSDSSSTVDASLVLSLLIWRCLTVGATPLRSYRFGVNHLYNRELPNYIKAIKAHPVYLELEALGMELYVGFEHSMPRR